MDLSLKQPLFIIGLQKSGTTLLNRLLMEQTDYFFSPFKLEGREFWGDDPPFTPTAYPCGEIYQKHQGKHGHQATEDDFDINHQKLLHQRISKVSIKAPILINKNPYNTMRIPWLKKMFPECKIVAMVRNPYANIFSLMKKHIPHEDRGLGPEDGWWGVKPKNWGRYNDKNLIRKITYQWKKVNQEILINKSNIDLVVEYSHLCHSPNHYISKISSLFNISTHTKQNELLCMDDEYKRGGFLLSKNRAYQHSQDLNLKGKFTQNNDFEVPPMSTKEKLLIRFLAMTTWLKLKILSENHASR